MRLWFVFLCLASAAVTALAATAWVHSPGRSSFKYPDPARPLNPQSIQVNPAGVGVFVWEPVGNLPATSGGAAIAAERVATRKAIATAAARAIPLVSTAVAIADLAQALRCGVEGGGWMCDPGQAPAPQTTWGCGTGSQRSFGPTPEVACSSYATKIAVNNPPSNVTTFARGTCTINTPTAAQCRYTRTYTACTSGAQSQCTTTTSDGNWAVSGSPGTGCAFGSPGLDGLCQRGEGDFSGGGASGSWAEPTTPEAVADKFNQYMPADKHAPIAEAILKGGHPLEMGPAELKGPASAQGTPKTTTTTGPNGTTSTTTTNQFNYQYSQGDVIITTTTTTNITKPDGTTESTTEGETPLDQSKDQCAKYPDTLGCAKVGEPPTDEVPKSQIQAPGFAAEPAPFGGSCPPPVAMPKGYGSISYQPACDAAEKMRPFVLACGWILALGICGFALRVG